jgi:3-hydroxyisobutyrate dehydrogenase
MSRKPHQSSVVALLGTGNIGAAMTRNLLRAGFEVRAWNRTPHKAEALAGDGALVASSPGEAVEAADVVLTSLFDAAAVRQVVEAAGPRLRPGVVWAEMSTLGIDDVAPLAALARDNGVIFVDAPVQGARPLAEQGELLIYAAGPTEAEAVLGPVFDVIGRRTDWLDDTHGSTAATATKLVVNGWLFALTTAAAEAVALARGLGVDPEHFRAAIADGPLDNAWAQLKSRAIIADDFAPLFPVRAAAKDAELIAAAAGSAGVQLDVAAAVRARFGRASAQGHADDDMIATYHASFGEPLPDRRA